MSPTNITMTRKIVGTLVGVVLLYGALCAVLFGSIPVAERMMGDPLTTSPVLLEEYERAAVALAFIIAAPQGLFIVWGVFFICDRRKLWIWRYWPRTGEAS